jgi:hypothetical protein
VNSIRKIILIPAERILFPAVFFSGFFIKIKLHGPGENIAEKFKAAAVSFLILQKINISMGFNIETEL